MKKKKQRKKIVNPLEKICHRNLSTESSEEKEMKKRFVCIKNTQLRKKSLSFVHYTSKKNIGKFEIDQRRKRVTKPKLKCMHAKRKENKKTNKNSWKNNFKLRR